MSRRERGGWCTTAATGSVAERIDALQYAAGQGPCLDAAVEQRPAGTGNLPAESRWPALVAAAGTGPVRSVISFPLRAGRRGGVAALNLFSTAADAFDADAVQVGGLFATHAGIALATERERGQLRAAIASRDAIGMAKGILMQQLHITDDEAFARLVAASQRTNTPVRHIALLLINDATRDARSRQG